MSDETNRFARKQAWRFRGKGPTGRNLCHCGCGREVPPPRRTAFSHACVEKWKRHNCPLTIARILLERDRGICAHCGLDTEALRRSCRPTGCNILPPDEFQIADGLGHKSQYYEDPRSCRWYEWRDDVAAAHEVARFMWNREVEIPWRAFQEERQKECAAMGFTDASRRWWEADHIVPVVEGGGGCGPEGYRTLCLPCHRIETAKLHGRLAAKRRIAKQPELAIA